MAATTPVQQASLIDHVDLSGGWPQARLALPGGLSVQVVRDLDGLQRLSRDWAELEPKSTASAVFQSHALLTIWAHHFTGAGHEGTRLRVVVVFRGKLPQLILPVVVTRRAALAVGRIGGAPIAQYSEIFSASDADLEACFAGALATLKRSGVDLLLLDSVRADSPLRRCADPRSRPALDQREAPFVDLDLAQDHETFVRGRSKNLLHGLRNKRKQLDRQGAVTFELLDGGPEAREAMSHAIDLKRAWLVQRGAVSNAFVDPTTSQCLLDLAESCPGASVMRLLVDGQPAAIRFGFQYRGRYFAYLSAYDPAFAQYAPGKLLMDFCLRSMRERGVTRVDMLPPAGEHKEAWCDTAVSVADYAIPLTAKGRLYSLLVQEKLRPALDWTWHHLPSPLRALVARHLLKI